MTLQEAQNRLLVIKDDLIRLSGQVEAAKATGNITTANNLIMQINSLSAEYASLENNIQAGLARANMYQQPQPMAQVYQQPYPGVASAFSQPALNPGTTPLGMTSTSPVSNIQYNNSMFSTGVTVNNSPSLVNDSLSRDDNYRGKRNEERRIEMENQTPLKGVDLLAGLEDIHKHHTPSKETVSGSKTGATSLKISTTLESMEVEKVTRKLYLGTINSTEGFKEILKKHVKNKDSLFGTDFVYLLKDIKEFNEELYDKINVILINRFNSVSVYAYLSIIRIEDILEDYRGLPDYVHKRPDLKEDINAISNHLLTNFLKHVNLSIEGNDVYFNIECKVLKANQQVSTELDNAFKTGTVFELINLDDTVSRAILNEYVNSGDVNYTMANSLSFPLYIEFNTFNFNKKTIEVFIASRKDKPEGCIITSNI